MTFVMTRLPKRTTVDPRNKSCDLYLIEYEGLPEEKIGLEAILQDPSVSDSQVRQLLVLS
jgi:hypothetical protein